MYFYYNTQVSYLKLVDDELFNLRFDLIIHTKVLIKLIKDIK